MAASGAKLVHCRMHIDDPLDASPVHFFCGAWSLLASGLFATEVSMLSISHWVPASVFVHHAANAKLMFFASHCLMRHACPCMEQITSGCTHSSQMCRVTRKLPIRMPMAGGFSMAGVVASSGCNCWGLYSSPHGHAYCLAHCFCCYAR